MKLILSDIHGNLEALHSVLKDASKFISSEESNEIFVLGDIVDYGADSVSVVNLLNEIKTEIRIKCLAGNHDISLFDSSVLPARSLRGVRSFNITSNELGLSEDSFRILKDLISDGSGHFYTSYDFESYSGQQVRMYHGTKNNHLWGKYGSNVEESLDSRTIEFEISKSLVFGGHSHKQGYTCISDDDSDGTYYYINPGSVGQPRNGDPRAQYAICDNGYRKVYFRRVPYDIKTAYSKILSSGRDSYYAERLLKGI